MVLPVVAYGSPILKKVAEDIELNKDVIQKLIADMYDTMYFCKGVGLAAPQINLSQRVFIIDSSQMAEDDERKKKDEKGCKQAFINPTIIEEFGEICSYEEGCLSIPNIYGNVERLEHLKIEYYDENLVFKTDIFSGFTARIIQHEYDHIEGVLFTDHLKPIKKQLIKRKLEDIRKGKIHSRYKMKFA